MRRVLRSKLAMGLHLILEQGRDCMAMQGRAPVPRCATFN